MKKLLLSISVFLLLLTGCNPDWSVGDTVEINGEAHIVTNMDSDGSYKTRRVK